MILADEITQHLSNKGFKCQTINLGECDAVKIKLNIADKSIELLHFPTNEISSMPIFLLSKPSDFGHLAHVTIGELGGIELGSICVNDQDSISVNFNMPLSAIEESLNRHISILMKSILDPEWNRQELLREFKSCWLNICEHDDRPVLLDCENGVLEEIDVYRPLAKNEIGISSYYIAQSKDTDLSAFSHLNSQSIAGKAIVLPLNEIEPAPLRMEYLEEWYLNTLNSLKSDVIKDLTDKYGCWKSNEYWVIFNAEVPSGKVWFCISFKNKTAKKQPLPLSKKKLALWKLSAVPIQLFNREAVLPRGGASLNLSKYKVALIGAGSVGGEIAHKLSSAGVQNLSIIDPDIYNIENLYRHVLPEQFLHLPKSLGLSIQLKRQFPWSMANGFHDGLLDLRNKALLKSYDLIVIAIGSPTHERLFKEYLLKEEINVPVINTWLEGFGVGGHAVLDIANGKGCLLCAYVCPDTLSRGLNSNLNFIEPNQDVTINMSGCGEQFISYGATCSAQTALIATDLAVKFLEGKIDTSTKVSWKGSDYDAKKNNIKLTNRYYKFTESLQIRPLIHEDCDVCN